MIWCLEKKKHFRAEKKYICQQHGKKLTGINLLPWQECVALKPQIFAVTRKITIPINLIGQGVMDRLQVSALDQLPITPTEPYLVRCRSFCIASSCLFLQLNVNDTSWLVTALTGNQSVCERSVINLCSCAVMFLRSFHVYRGVPQFHHARIQGSSA